LFFEALLPARDRRHRGLQTPHDLAVTGAIGQRQALFTPGRIRSTHKDCMVLTMIRV
jgi:hypothetical protein